MNADWAPGGRQPPDQTNRFGLWVRRSAAIIRRHHRHFIITQLVSWHSFYRPTVKLLSEQCAHPFACSTSTRPPTCTLLDQLKLGKNNSRITWNQLHNSAVKVQRSKESGRVTYTHLSWNDLQPENGKLHKS